MKIEFISPDHDPKGDRKETAKLERTRLDAYLSTRHVQPTPPQNEPTPNHDEDRGGWNEDTLT